MEQNNNNVNNNNINNNIDNNIFEENAENENKRINELLFLLKGFENNINLIESKLNCIPFSYKENFEKKLNNLKLDLCIKNNIYNYYSEFNNFITRRNMISVLNSIIDFSSLKLYKLYNNDANKKNIAQKFEIIKQIINCNRIQKRVKMPELDKYYTYTKLTKNYSNEEEFLEDKNHAIEEKLNFSYLDVLNINFITGEIIRYDILSEILHCEKVVPISYNYNLKYNSINFQEIILYNLKQDKKIYYGEYNIKYNEIDEESLIKLIDVPIYNCIKIILINKGIDLFILGKKNNNPFNTSLNAYYIGNFRIKPIVSEYKIHGEYNIIFNDYTICIQTKNKLMFMNRTIKKDVNIFSGKDLVDNIDINNLGQDFIDDNDMENNNNNNIQNNNVDDIIAFQNNIMNALGGDMDLLIENLDNLNNLNLPPLHSSTIFQVNEEGIKSHFLNLLNMNDKYFVVLSSKKVKKLNNPLKIYFYISLFDFETMEEISKIEIDMFELEENKNIWVNLINEYEKKLNIIINISQNDGPVEEKKYFFILNKGELIEAN